MQADAGDLSLLGRLYADRAAEEQVIEIMGPLAVRGQHRAPSIADLFVAAVARIHNATVLHYDNDFELIADVTGQRHEWGYPARDRTRQALTARNSSWPGEARPGRV